MFKFCYLFVISCLVQINSGYLLFSTDDNVFLAKSLKSERYQYDVSKPKYKEIVTENKVLKVGRGINGGFACGACTVLVGMGEQLADINNETLAEGLERLCGVLPSPLNTDCTSVVFTLGPAVLEFLKNSSTPDSVCYSVGLCVPEPEVCNLFPAPAMPMKLLKKFALTNSQKSKTTELMLKAFPWLCYIPGVSQICEAFEKTFHDLVPGLDIDEDGFSPAETFRGALWRGRDCHDGDSDVHPGRIPKDSDRHLDSNCNGIHGINDLTGLPWEEELCTGTAPKGIIYLGDWPHLGFATGFRNGANSTDTLFYIKSLSQNKRDLPAIVFYALIGNDVCTEKVDPDSMTTVEKFRNNTLTVLDILEKQLAAGSHVVLVGLIDAGFLYEEMGERVHPLGKVGNNIRYKIINLTMFISDALKDIAATYKYYNFDLTFIDNPFHKVLDTWVASGRKIYELVEPVDSLHPTQLAQSLIAEQVWSDLESKAPHVLGPVNPNNHIIKQLFVHQGGH